MANFSQTHPAMAAKLADLIESGLNPEQIIQHFKSEDEAKAISDKEWDDVEVFPDAIHIISQALAYRDAVAEDVDELYQLINSAYKPEVIGDESFRTGDVVIKEDIHSILADKTYKWLLVEAPSGKNIEQDGVILGAVCYTVDGVSRKNGLIEGKLGSIRFLAVLPRYHGFCVGRRLLERAEDIMFSLNCCKVMVCIPTTRITAMEWLDRRGYTETGAVPYPTQSLNHTLKAGVVDVELVRFIKCKPEPSSSSQLQQQEGKASTGTWHLKHTPTIQHSTAKAMQTIVDNEEDDFGVD